MAIEIYPLKVGEVQLDSSFMVWQMNPGTPVQAPCTAFLILGAGEPILVDAGISTIAPPFSQAPDQTLDTCLARHGLEPGDIKILVHTHLHGDHAGLDDRLPNARIIVQREELSYASAPLFPSFFYNPDDLAKLTGPLRDRVELIDGDSTVVEGVRTVVTGGHTPAHQMLEVELESGLAIVTGDVAYLADPGVTEQVPSGYWVDLGDVLAALARIKRDATHVLPSHDPAVHERYADGIR
jgi:glyoxylase-like metal-dependent hydrolase (beta-lactamase superfamily II)